MGSAVKVYQVFCEGESKSKIEIQVFHEGGYYSAVMIPLDSGDPSLMRLFQDPRNRHEVGTTIEEAVACCEKWIKKNLYDDVEIRENRTPPAV